MNKSIFSHVFLGIFLWFMQSFGLYAQQDQFRVLEGIPHLPVFANTAVLASPETGMWIYSVSNDGPVIYDGVDWIDLCYNSASGVANTYFQVKNKIPYFSIQASAISNPASGSMYLNSSANIVSVYTGSSWVDFRDLNDNNIVENAKFSSLSGAIQLPVLSSNPSPAGLSAGAIYFSSVDKALKYYDGTAWNEIICNYGPVPNPVTITVASVVKEGYNLTGSYTYTDVENDLPDTPLLQWYRADNNTGTNLTAITGETGSVYTMGASDVDKYITFGVTLRALTGRLVGKEVLASYEGPVLINDLPVVNSVAYTGTQRNFEVLTGTYIYFDTEANPENGTTFKWYRADDDSGTNATAIAGSTAQTYTLTLADVGKHIAFSVTPASSVGNSPGLEVLSSYNSVAIIDNDVPIASAVSFSGTLRNFEVVSGAYTYFDTETDPQSGTTFKWYRADDDAGTNAIAIAGATTQTYSLTQADVGKHIAFAVTPAASFGNSPGLEVLSSYSSSAVIDNDVPIASLVNFSGTLRNFETLTGSYTYSDTEGDPNVSSFKWYRANDNSGGSAIEIGSATANTYTLTAADLGKYIAFGVTPAASFGNSPGVEVISTYSSSAVIDNDIPIASAVNFSGDLFKTQILTGSYTYADTENDAAASIFKWYRADNDAGLNALTISGATAQTYTLVAADVNKYIAFAVVPASSFGNSPGLEVRSAYKGPVSDNLPPLASSVSISVDNILKEGYGLTGSYIYSDTEGDSEAGTVKQWYRADNSGGTNRHSIIGENGTTYTLTSLDVNKYITYGVIPGASSGSTPGTEVFATYKGPVLANELPIASSVIFAGVLKNTEILSGTYTYSDVENDVESGTSLKWYRADNSSGLNQVGITSATASNYTLTTADVGKYVAYAVKPAASSGNSPGLEVISTYQGPIIENAAPVFASVSVSGGVLQVGYSLTASYTGYSDVDSDLAGTHIYKWYTANDIGGTGQAIISGENSSSYLIQVGDVGKFISVGITPVATSGTSPGVEVFASYVGPILPNQAPVITNLSIPSSLFQTATASPSYTYSDNENDAQGTHIYNWELASDVSGNGALSVSSSSSYTLQAADIGKYLRLTMTPKAATGAPTGISVQTEWIGPIQICGGIISHNGTTYNTVLLTPAGKDASCWMKESIDGNFSGITNYFISPAQYYYSARDVFGNPTVTAEVKPDDYRHHSSVCPTGWALPSYNDFDNIRNSMPELSKLEWNQSGTVLLDNWATSPELQSGTTPTLLGSNYSVNMTSGQYVSSGTLVYYFTGASLYRQSNVYQWTSSNSWERRYLYQIKCVKD